MKTDEKDTEEKMETDAVDEKDESEAKINEATEAENTETGRFFLVTVSCGTQS